MTRLHQLSGKSYWRTLLIILHPAPHQTTLSLAPYVLIHKAGHKFLCRMHSKKSRSKTRLRAALRLPCRRPIYDHTCQPLRPRKDSLFRRNHRTHGGNVSHGRLHRDITHPRSQRQGIRKSHLLSPIMLRIESFTHNRSRLQIQRRIHKRRRYIKTQTPSDSPRKP
jgi:hypothetical protein